MYVWVKTQRVFRHTLSPTKKETTPWVKKAGHFQRKNPLKKPEQIASNVASPISAATKSVASNATPAKAHFPDRLAQTARKSTALRKPTAPKRSSVQTKPDENVQGGADTIIVTESEDVPLPPRSKQFQRKSAVPQSKPVNGSVKGKGKTQGLQRDDPIDLEPPDGVSDVSDVEMSIPTPRPRSSPNESSSVSAKEETLQRKLLQASPSFSWVQLQPCDRPILFRARRPTNRYGNKSTSYLSYRRINNKRWRAGRCGRRLATEVYIQTRYPMVPHLLLQRTSITDRRWRKVASFLHPSTPILPLSYHERS